MPPYALLARLTALSDLVSSIPSSSSSSAPPAEGLTITSSSTSNASSSSSSSSGSSPALPPCPDSPSSGQFPTTCTPPIPTPYGSQSPYNPAQLGVIGFVSCAAVLVAAGGVVWWAWKWRRRARERGRQTVVVQLAGGGIDGTSSNPGSIHPPVAVVVPQTVRLPASAFTRSKKRKRSRPSQPQTGSGTGTGSEHELQPPSSAQPARNPDGTIRDAWDEEGLDTMGTFETVDTVGTGETGETLVGEKLEGAEPDPDGEGKTVDLGGEDGDGVGEVPLSIQRLTLGPMPPVASMAAEVARPAPTYLAPSKEEEKETEKEKEKMKDKDSRGG